MRQLIRRETLSKPIIGLMLICFSCLFGILFPQPAMAVPEDANGAKAIAMVYDDSRSMYDGTERWCKAKYSLEVLASMIDDSDKMQVFPLNCEVFPVDADSPQNRANKIHETKIYRVGAYGTPGDRVVDATNWLEGITGASGRYLVIATDGGFSEETEAAAAQAAYDALDEEIAVILIEIGHDDTFLDGCDNPNLFRFNADDAGNSNAILDTMINVSQMIFGRHELDAKNYDKDAGKLTLPTSSTKLIVFAQGGNTSVSPLHGETSDVPSTSASVSYSDLPSDDYIKACKNPPKQDTSLNGEIVIFNNSDGSSLPAGEYELSAQADAINIYYEPDVSIKATFSDSEGNERILTEVTDDSFLVPGDYTVNLSLIDNVTGEDVSSIFGLDNAELVIEDPDTGESRTYSNGDAVTLSPGVSSGQATCEVVDDLVVRTKYSSIEVFDNTLEVSMAQIEPAPPETVDIFNVDKLKFEIYVTKNGEPLSQDEWTAVSLALTERFPGVDWTWERADDVSKFIAIPHWRGGFLGLIAGMIVGHDGPVVVDSALRSGSNRAYATISYDYHINRNLVPIIIFLAILLAILFLIVSRGYVKPFMKAKVEANVEMQNHARHRYTEVAIPNKTSNTAKIKGFFKSILPGMNCAETRLSCSVLTPTRLDHPSTIDLRGARFRLGRKVHFVNWSEWKKRGWRIDNLEDPEEEHPLINHGTVMRYRGNNQRNRNVKVDIYFKGNQR